MTSRRTVITVTIGTLAALTPLVPLTPVDAGGCRNIHVNGRFATIELPAEASAPPATPATTSYPLFAASRSTPDLVVTDVARRTLFHSANGGCTWQRVYSLDEAEGMAGEALGAMHYRLSALAFAPPGNNRRPGVVAVATDPDDAAATWFVFQDTPGDDPGEGLPMFFLNSFDAGRSWKVAASGETGSDLMDTTRHPRCKLAAVAPDQLDAGTVSVDCSLRDNWDGEAVYVTHDAGETWKRTLSEGRPWAPYMPNSGFTADPLHSGLLWTSGTIQEKAEPGAPPPPSRVGPYLSPDGGEHWAAGPLAAEKLADANEAQWVTRMSTGAPGTRTLAFYSPSGLYVSQDDGTRWRRAAAFANAAEAGDLEGAVVVGRKVYAVEATPHRAYDGGNTTTRTYCRLLRAGHKLIQLTPKRRWHDVGRTPQPVNSTNFQHQVGFAGAPMIFALALTVADPDSCTGYRATLLRMRP